MVVFVKCRRSESKCFKRSYVFADCDHEDKRKCKSNIVCLDKMPPTVVACLCGLLLLS